MDTTLLPQAGSTALARRGAGDLICAVSGFTQQVLTHQGDLISMILLKYVLLPQHEYKCFAYAIL